jgi:hypothetical protein
MRELSKDASVKEADERMLRELLASSLDEDEEERFNARAFREMLDRGRPLSEKQHAWVADVYEKVIGDPQYLNLWSAGRVPKGRDVPTPEVLTRSPKRPPTRRSEP